MEDLRLTVNESVNSSPLTEPCSSTEKLLQTNLALKETFLSAEISITLPYRITQDFLSRLSFSVLKHISEWIHHFFFFTFRVKVTHDSYSGCVD